MLPERQSRILWAIVDGYLANALPVGSRIIAKKYFRDEVSPATIRNEMADLEEAGFLMQPHTSAGRIPTDKGYRYFVDYLMAIRDLTTSEKHFVDDAMSRFEEQKTEIHDLLQNIASILSQLTNYPSCLLSPAKAMMKFSNIQLVKTSSRKALLILIGEGQVFEQRWITLSEDMDQGKLHEISMLLNAYLSGATLTDIRAGLMGTLVEEQKTFCEYRAFLRNVAEGIDMILGDEYSAHIYTDGVGKVLGEPEFQNPERVHGIVNFFERKRLLRDILCRASLTKGVEISIGAENGEDLSELSIITAPYTVNDQVVGALGIIGPRRMDYAGAITAIKEIASGVSNRFSALCEI
ncbi:MAG: heat-inducible transcription repressor HrcA [Candidatus Wallbacteria bacterium HGW-Wallbacteria-1]|jgi:heat-inducible transcriptional repressor|uniref:Heat-inducible transcription repressor HrcA n=1 Tax=Candidatus Wallbacteria bacterium HGW-Wallbacteria-1 TaxID=2013854 RepID=A0A2N1PQI6_9BACT|nr:MAG: heat-inducible transcription repressor HrcA [Candidatus Wallbacteria bacterium HGW-Wallbacteria-1]